MTTLTVNIDNKKSEKAIKAVLDALKVDYREESNTEIAPHVMAGLFKSKECVAQGRCQGLSGPHRYPGSLMELRVRYTYSMPDLQSQMFRNMFITISSLSSPLSQLVISC